MDKKTWKERLEAIPPQGSIAAVLRELHRIGVKISDKGLRKQNDKHGIIEQSGGLFIIRVDTVLSLRLWKDSNGDHVTDDQAADQTAVQRYALARAKKTEAEARIKEREDALAAGDLIHKDDLNKRVLAPAILLQKSILSSVDKQVESIIDLVDGDHGKAHAVSRDVRLWLKEHLARAYAGTVYELTIDPVNRSSRQISLINE